MNQTVPAPDPTTRTIPLTQGEVALCDLEDYDFLMQWKWFLIRFISSTGKVFLRAFAWNGKNHVGKETIIMSRLVMNAPDRYEVDHINHNPLDNRRCNLRLCTKSQNSQNRTKGRGHHTSYYKGVSWHSISQRWRTQITVNGHTRHLGEFSNEKDAAGIYDEAALELFGEFAYINAR